MPFRTIHAIPSVKFLPILLSALFILLGGLFIPYAGIQNDEALFAAPLYGPVAREFRITVFHHEVPLMLMNYLGTLKTWLYGAIFALWKPGVWSVRLPVLLAGAASILLFWHLLRRAAGTGAAALGALLLVTDSTYLLTSVFDWGPVAFQHLLLVGGALLVLSAAQGDSRTRLGWGFFLFGLGMWDKALFSWTLGGLVVATLLVFPRELIRRFTIRHLAVAALGFCLGALPLILYNIRHPLQTFRGNAHFTTEGFVEKAKFVRATADGSSLFGYLVPEEWAEHPRQPRGVIERTSLSLRDNLGEHRRGLLFWGFVAALAAVPLWWRSWRPVAFGCVFLAVAWLQMAITKDAGGGTHHVVLLWPFPQFVIAAALAKAAERFRGGWTIAGVVTIAICASNLMVLNQHLAQYVRYGSTTVWTDAIGPLAEYVESLGERDAFMMDWGMYDTVRMLDRGKPVMWWGGDGVAANADPQLLPRMLERPAPLFVTHTAGNEVNEGVRERLRLMAERLGYERRIVRMIADANGRPVFEVSEFHKLH